MSCDLFLFVEDFSVLRCGKNFMSLQFDLGVTDGSLTSIIHSSITVNLLDSFQTASEIDIPREVDGSFIEAVTDNYVNRVYPNLRNNNKIVIFWIGVSENLQEGISKGE
jgi:hypothetical protein